MIVVGVDWTLFAVDWVEQGYGVKQTVKRE